MTLSTKQALGTFGLAVLLLLNPLTAAAGDVKSYATIGICHGTPDRTRSDYGAVRVVGNTAGATIQCPVMRDLPQKTRVKRLTVGVELGHAAVAGETSCTAHSAPLDYRFTNHTTRIQIPAGTTGRHTVEFKNLRIDRHARLWVRCYLPGFGTMTGVSIEE